MNNYLPISEVANKYHVTFQNILHDLSLKCLGGEAATLNFPEGSITIRLK